MKMEATYWLRVFARHARTHAQTLRARTRVYNVCSAARTHSQGPSKAESAAKGSYTIALSQSAVMGVRDTGCKAPSPLSLLQDYASRSAIDRRIQSTAWRWNRALCMHAQTCDASRSARELIRVRYIWAHTYHAAYAVDSLLWAVCVCGRRMGEGEERGGDQQGWGRGRMGEGEERRGTSTVCKHEQQSRPGRCGRNQTNVSCRSYRRSMCECVWLCARGPQIDTPIHTPIVSNTPIRHT